MAYDVVIERGKVREFARAAKSRHPAYDGDAPVIPPTFLTTAQAFWAPAGALAATFGDLDFDLARLLHGEEEFEFFGAPPRAGDVLRAESRVADRYEREGRRGGTMRFARIVTEFREIRYQRFRKAS